MQKHPTDLDNITSYDLLKLCMQIFECIENPKGESPYIDILSDNILIITMDDKKFRVIIDDLTLKHSEYN